jgi:hypothetical protein
MSVSRSWLRWGLVACVAAAVAALVFATQPRPQYQDASMFMVIGRGILDGRAPFTGLFDDKPPGMYLVGGLAWLLDPSDSTVSMQALSVVAIAVAATACGWIVSRVYSRFWVGAATALLAAGGLSLPLLTSGGGGTELFGVAGIAVSAAGVVGIMSGRKGVWWAAGAGAGFAWAIGCSLLSVATLPALALLWLNWPIDGEPYALARSNWRTWIRRRIVDRRVAIAVGGAVVVSAGLWWPVLAGGALPAAFDALVRYNSLYRMTGILHARIWVNAFGIFWPLWLPTLVLLMFPSGRRRVLGMALWRSNLARAMVLWLLGAMALLLFGRRFYPHYLLLLVPPLVVLLGMALAQLADARRPLNSRGVSLAVCVAIGLGLALQCPPAASTDSARAANAELASYVQANSAAADQIYVWGFDPDIYLLADREPAGPYFELVPLIMPGYDTQAVETMVHAWQSSPPRLIVTSDSAKSNAIRLDPLVVAPGYTNPGEPSDYPALDPLRTFIKAHYEVVATLPLGQVWRYKG